MIISHGFLPSQSLEKLFVSVPGERHLEQPLWCIHAALRSKNFRTSTKVTFRFNRLNDLENREGRGSVGSRPSTISTLAHDAWWGRSLDCLPRVVEFVLAGERGGTPNSCLCASC